MEELSRDKRFMMSSSELPAHKRYSTTTYVQRCGIATDRITNCV